MYYQVDACANCPWNINFVQTGYITFWKLALFYEYYINFVVLRTKNVFCRKQRSPTHRWCHWTNYIRNCRYQKIKMFSKCFTELEKFEKFLTNRLLSLPLPLLIKSMYEPWIFRATGIHQNRLFRAHAYSLKRYN